jgi:hypothetical protein
MPFDIALADATTAESRRKALTVLYGLDALAIEKEVPAAVMRAWTEDAVLPPKAPAALLARIARGLTEYREHTGETALATIPRSDVIAFVLELSVCAPEHEAELVMDFCADLLDDPPDELEVAEACAEHAVPLSAEDAWKVISQMEMETE